MRRLSIVLLALGWAFGLSGRAYAHPLGNFTLNHYAGLHVSSQAIAIDYVLDMAEIPAFQEIAGMDANRNDRPDPEEAAAYHPAQCAALRPELELRVDGRPLALSLTASAVEFPPGAGGLLTLRLTCAFSAPIQAVNQEVRLEFTDHAYARRLGWREIVVVPDGVLLVGDFATTSLSQRLTAYPDDLLASPPDQRQVSFRMKPGTAQRQPAQLTERLEPVSLPGGGRQDAFTQLVTLPDLSLPAMLAAFAVAFVWGAMHAMSPGHGKTIVGAYLVGSRGTARHALYLGLTTTITHTAGVFALGLVTLFASHFILPERLFPWLGLVSGLLVVGIGLSLLIGRMRQASRAHHAHDHGHHPHGPDDQHADHEHHPHHAPGPHGHAHLPPGADGSPVSWRSLLALGISGGLLPCPSALVVLLSAIALDRVGFGLVLVLVFSLGLAGALTGMGLALVCAGRLFERLPVQGRVVKWVPAMSALFITVVGLGITAQAMMQIGRAGL
jgi:ABC-type nickel/cobalt efflux system permease component RcnA